MERWGRVWGAYICVCSVYVCVCIFHVCVFLCVEARG